jgi:hypothetical protein
MFSVQNEQRLSLAECRADLIAARCRVAIATADLATAEAAWALNSRNDADDVLLDRELERVEREMLGTPGCAGY